MTAQASKRMSEVKNYPSLSRFVFLKDNSGIVAAETERIAQSRTHGALLGLVKGEVEAVIDFLILIALLMVDGGGNDILAYRKGAEHCLKGACSTEKVTCHRFGRADVEVFGMFAKHLLDSLDFRNIAYGG